MITAEIETLEQRMNGLLIEAEARAWKSLAQGKFSLFGYWAAKVVQFREALQKSSEPSPFRELVKTAKAYLER